MRLFPDLGLASPTSVCPRARSDRPTVRIFKPADLQQVRTGADTIGHLTVSGFTGWHTDMSFQPGNDLPPTTMDRSISGNVVGFSFVAPPLGFSVLPPGSVSQVLLIQTNASDWTLSTGDWINASIASGPAYAPVPEPVTMLLLVGSLGMGLLRRRR